MTFPIKTATACQYKWTWSTIFLSMGTTSSCHRCKGWGMDITGLKDFHNHPGKIHDRKKMLEGEWPGNGCEYCRDIEQAGGLSERVDFINDSPVTPPEIEAGDLEATHVTPRILEVYFSNVCNQACVYCGPQFSSQIAAEITKHGALENIYDLDGSYKPHKDYEMYKRQFWEWMEEHSTSLYRFHVLGGEPLYQKEFDECLNFFKNKSHPDLDWNIFTNLKHPKEKLKEKLDIMETLIYEKRLKNVSFIVSQDCWGQEAEYARYGTNMKAWEENFNLLLEYPWLKVNVHSTLTCVTLPSAYKLAEKIKEWRKKKDVSHGWNIIVHPSFFAPEIFGKHMEDYFTKLIETVGDNNKHAAGYLKGFRDKVVNKPVNVAELIRLRDVLDKLDERRGLNWRETYPWMDKIMKDTIIHG
jgi:organic radical activating enzyme